MNPYIVCVLLASMWSVCLRHKEANAVPIVQGKKELRRGRKEERDTSTTQAPTLVGSGTCITEGILWEGEEGKWTKE